METITREIDRSGTVLSDEALAISLREGESVFLRATLLISSNVETGSGPDGTVTFGINYNSGVTGRWTVNGGISSSIEDGRDVILTDTQEFVEITATLTTTEASDISLSAVAPSGVVSGEITIYIGSTLEVARF